MPGCVGGGEKQETSLASAFSSIFTVKETTDTLDTGFGTGGIVAHHSAAEGNGYDGGRAITTDADGKILAAGQSYSGGSYDMVIWRYR